MTSPASNQPKRQRCPDQRWLKRLIDGRVTEQQEMNLTGHLDECESCRRALGQLTKSDYFSAAETPQPAPAQLIETLKRIRSDRTEIRKTAGYTDILAWIDRAADPYLGQVKSYLLTDFVGRGGMGIVFRAWDKKLGRKVALKVMSPSLLEDETAVRRFVREARTGARINHPYVVTVFSVGAIRDLPFLAMELVDGQSLDQILQRQGALSEFRAMQIARQVAAGLAEAHQLGFLHRDIKPANILLRAKDHVAKLADFGLARSAQSSRLTRSGMCAGSPGYAAPETLQPNADQTVDVRSDLFSLGVVMYQMLAGAMPFQDGHWADILHSMKQNKPIPLLKNNPGISQGLAAIVHRLLLYEPDRRFSSCEQLLQALQNLERDGAAEKFVVPPPVVATQKNTDPLSQSGQSVTLKIKPTDALTRKPRKPPLALLASVSLLVVVALGIGWALFALDWGQRRFAAPEPAGPKSAGHSAANERLSNTDGWLLVRNGNELAELLEGDQDELKIHLIAGRSYEMNPVAIQDKSIQLQTGTPEEFANGADEEIPPAEILMRGGAEHLWHLQFSQVRLANITIVTELPEMDEADDEQDHDVSEPIETAESLFCYSDSEIEFINCQLLGWDTTACLIIEDSSVSLTDCRLFATEIGVVWSPTDVDHVLGIERSVLASHTLIDCQERFGRIEVNESTLFGSSAFGIETDLEDADSKPVSVASERSRFVMEDSLILAHSIEESDEDEEWSKPDVFKNKIPTPKSMIQWTGFDSQLPSVILSVQDDPRSIIPWTEQSWLEMADESLPSTSLPFDSFGVDSDEIRERFEDRDFQLENLSIEQP